MVFVTTHSKYHISKLRFGRWVYNHWTLSPYQLAFKGEFYPSGCNSGIRAIHSFKMTLVLEL